MTSGLVMAHRLFTDVVIRAHEKSDEDGNSTLLDHNPRVVASSAGNVGQSPC